MTLPFVRSVAGVALWIMGLASVLFVLDIGRITEIPGTQMIRQVTLCDSASCTGGTPQALPYFSPIHADATHATLHLHTALAQPPAADRMQALYVPKFTGILDLHLNGRVIFADATHRRLWNEPVLVPIPPALLGDGPLELSITLRGPPSEGLDLQPFFFGAQDVLAPYQKRRFLMGPGLARFALGLMVVLGVSLSLVWCFRPKEKEYLWLGLACVAAMPTLAQFGYSVGFGGYKIWTLLWVMGISLYVLLIMKFLRCFLKLSDFWPEDVHKVLTAVSWLCIMLLPAGYIYSAALLSNLLITAPSAMIAVSTLWINRHMLSPIDTRVFFPCLSIAVALGLYELYLLLHPAPLRTMHLFQFMPLVMSLACIWLILSRLIQSLRGYETLTASLSQTIAEKSAELEASFADLAEVKRREAIAEERERIMLDLHDGIGGHLVSTLAYMQSNGVGDEKIRRSLEEALRDLALMLDSMENHESLVTLLGMLRTRLEGLLSEHGLEFDWQVHGEPSLARPGPSQSLHLARIVQEAITNVIKHAKADTITIYVDETQIRISDNGKGFDVASLGSGPRPTHGIANMKKRSIAIGTEFSIDSTKTGTDITLGIVGAEESGASDEEIKAHQHADHTRPEAGRKRPSCR